MHNKMVKSVHHEEINWSGIFIGNLMICNLEKYVMKNIK